MRAKHFILIIFCVVITTIFFVVLGPAGEPNDSLKSIVTQTHQQLNKFQENLRDAEEKKLEIDPKYLEILGFTSSVPTKESQNNNENTADTSAQQMPEAQPLMQEEFEPETPPEPKHVPLQREPYNIYHSDTQSVITNVRSPPHIATTPFNGTKANFTIVTYAQEGQVPGAVLLSQNIAIKWPNEHVIIYDLGLSEEQSRSLNSYCNNSRCSVIVYDLSVFPSHVADQRMHAFRPLVIKDALIRSKSILFLENYMRVIGNSRDITELQSKVMVAGVLGWTTPTAVSTRTHPKMFDYFQTDADDFLFLRMIEVDAVLFTDSRFVRDKILLPWIKCVLTLECIDPIGAQWNGCKYNKKPQYRYSGCHSYDASAFNIVLGLTWRLDDSKYSLPSESYNIFYKETFHMTKLLESRRRNSSDLSEIFSDE